MKKYFLLLHDRQCTDYLKNGLSEHVKEIGVFSSKSEAKKVKKLYRSKSGFKDYPKAFIIVELKLNKIYLKKGF